jgi:2-polyprenyl-3-methyl-5-hydroxy-6-metoxy-1,4-benzoquinol methylase
LTATLAYTFNHHWTFERSKIRHGWFGGWLEYISVCGIAELTYIGMLALFTEVFHIWYMISASMAITINYPIKYMVVSKLVWKTKTQDSCESKDFEWRAYYKANIFRRAWKRAITNRISGFVNSYPNGSILDLGCGSSPTVIFLNHNHYLGMDSNVQKIRYMQGKRLEGCEFKVGDIVHEIPDTSFDTVLCIELLEHFERPEQILDEISKRLVKGGKLILATPNRKSFLWNIIEKAQQKLQPSYHTFTHKRLYSKDDLDSLCSGYGLKNIKTDYVALGMDMILYYEKI